MLLLPSSGVLTTIYHLNVKRLVLTTSHFVITSSTSSVSRQNYIEVSGDWDQVYVIHLSRQVMENVLEYKAVGDVRWEVEFEAAMFVGCWEM